VRTDRWETCSKGSGDRHTDYREQQS